MKLTELIDDLAKKLDDYGDIDVWSRYSCGCCSYEEEPRLSFEEYNWQPTGLYLN